MLLAKSVKPWKSLDPSWYPHPSTALCSAYIDNVVAEDRLLHEYILIAGRRPHPVLAFPDIALDVVLELADATTEEASDQEPQTEGGRPRKQVRWSRCCHR